mmetsp:Transcript_4387/g.10725  ORF Transcript_4387/g.10725 Transcript_4387/m.10725 type:complete len:224 (-) Transcript_4387:64-735(-)
MQVSACCLRGAGEELAEALESTVVPRIRCERDDQPLVGMRSEGAHHLRHLVLRVMNHHVNAGHRVVVALNTLQVGRGELDVLHSQARRAGGAFLRHGGADVRRTHLGAALCERDGERADATPGVAERLPLLRGAVRVHPLQHFLDGLRVAVPNVHLHGVDLAVLTVDARPPVKPLGVEILAHLRLVVDDSADGGGRGTAAAGGGEERAAGCGAGLQRVHGREL